MNPFSVISRAFASDLRSISVTENERTGLAATGIKEPTIQRYFVWRKSMVLMVVIATALSAGLATFRNLTEPDDQPNVLESVVDEVLHRAGIALPEAAKAAHASADKDETEDEAGSQPNAMGRFADGVELAALYALAMAAMTVIFCGNRFRLSFNILAAGFAIGFFVPFLLAMCPWSWWGIVEPVISPAKEPSKYLLNIVEGIVEGASYLVTLLPAVLSLVPGILRASLRVKTLVPAALLPGWIIVVAAPLYAFFLLVVFVAINQMISEPVVFGGMFLLMAAPLVCVFFGNIATSPLLSSADYSRMKNVQRIVGAMTLVAGGLMVTWLMTRDVLGVHFVGLDPKKCLMQPVELVEYLLQIVSRSMFVTLLGADLIMRMNLTAWKHVHALAGSEESKGYDRVMEAMESVSK